MKREEEEKAGDSTTEESLDVHETEQEREKQISFADHLWDSLDSIKENGKKGTNILEGVINFSKSYHRAYETYALNISKALDVFEREMLKYNSLDTTTICMSSF